MSKSFEERHSRNVTTKIAIERKETSNSAKPTLRLRGACSHLRARSEKLCQWWGKGFDGPRRKGA